MRVILLIFFFIIFAFEIFGQAAGDFRTFQNGDWNNVNTWERFDGTDWVSPAPGTPSNSSGVITIRNPHTITVTANVVVDQVTVAVGGIINITAGIDFTVTNGTGTDLVFGTGGFGTNRIDVGGRIIIEESATISGATTARLKILNGGFYRHNYTVSSGIIYTADWATGSTLEITGYTTSLFGPSGLGQPFYNVVWNCESFSDLAIDLQGGLTTVGGDLNIQSTNGTFLVFSFSNPYTLNVAGNFNVTGNSAIAFNDFESIASTINVGGNFSYSSSAESWFSVDGSLAMVVTGDFSASSGTIDLLSGAGASSGTSMIQVNGNLSLTTGATITESSEGAAPSFVFVKSGIQTYTGGATTPNSSSINFTVNSGSTLDLGTFPLGGNGTFTSNGTVRVGSLNSAGAIQGNIPMTNRVFNLNSTIIYNGTAAQFMGTAQPPGTGVNTIINNITGVSLSATPVTIGGNLTLTNGNLSIGDNNTLTLGGTLTPNSNSIAVTSASNISITGAGPFGTLPLSGSTTLNNFSINRTPGGSVTLGSDMTIDGAFTQTAGTLILNGNDLTVSGDYTATDGDITSNASSSLIIEDNGTLPGSLNISGGFMGTFTLNRPSSNLEVPATFTVTNLNLLQGVYDNEGGNTTMATGGTITRSVGSMTQEPVAVTTYNVVYTGTTNLNTGVELSPSEPSRLNNLTNSNSGIVTLNDDITINGNLTLSGGSFNAGTRTVILRGNLISNAGSTFTSSPFFFAGNTLIQGSSIPTFGDFTVNDLSTVTFPTGILNVTRDMLFDPGSTINHGGGTIRFTGAFDQTLGGGGKSLNNITVNKSAEDVFLQSPVNLIGLLSIQTATELSSDGNLILVSTSDGASGNASIAALPTGASITGNVTVQRFMSEEGRIYRYISSPVANPPVTDLQDDFPITGTFSGASTCSGCLTNPSMYYWDETITGDITQGYIPYPVASNSETLAVGRGYAAFIRDNIIPGPVTIDLTGTVNQGPISIPMTFTSSDPGADGWTLVGNPYPSTINWTLVTPPDRPGVSSVIAVRDNGAGGVYQYYPTGTNLLVSGRIAAGQGFWARTTANGSINLIEAHKDNTTGAFYREFKEEQQGVFIISLAKDGIVDRAFVRMMEDSQPELDDNDAPKLNNETFDISTMTAGGISMAVNATNEMICDAINLKIADMPAGSYTMSVESIGVFTNFSPRLVDNFTNTIHDFSLTAEYQFDVTSDAASSAFNRFSIQLDLPAINPDAISSSLEEITCNEDYKINLDNTEANVFYFADLNGVVLSDSVLSNGTDPIVLAIDSAKLGIGANEVVIKGYNYCATIPMTNSVAVNHDILYSATASNETQCLDGAVDIEAQGAPSNGSYNWYETETSSEPIQGQHESVYTTPVLSKTSTFYVAAVNSNGCEGARIPVVAEVIQYVPVTISESIPGELMSSYSEGNQWYLDGVIIDGATGQTIVPEESGQYNVEVSLSGGCTTTAAMDFAITGVETANPHNGISVYPNPLIDDVLHVRVAPGAKVGPIGVFNNLGTKVGDVKLAEKEGGMEGSLDMRNSASGVYYVRTLLNKQAVTLKVIKK